MGKIFVIGLSKTGTKTVTYVLQELGLKILHNPTKYELWQKEYDGFADIPVIPHYKELDRKYPNSKFIYTDRDMKDWSVSLHSMFQRKNMSGKTNRKNIRESVYGDSNPTIEQLELAYIKHALDVSLYFSDRQDDLLRLNLFENPSPKKLYEFIGRQGTFKKYPLLGEGIDTNVNDKINLKKRGMIK